MSKISYCSLEEAWGTTYKKPIEPTQAKIKLLENNENTEYNKYRFNPINKVVDNNPQQYTPFNESIEKKYLMDKLNFLENEFRKYKDVFEQKNNNINNNIIENFSNQTIEETPKNNDIIDLCLLIIIGLILIFVMNSIFNIGKSIGARK